MTTTKIATGWTVENTAKLVTAYSKGETPLKELAAMFGKSEAAVRGKLVSEKVYVKRGGSAETGSKAEYVAALRILTGLSGLESLEKANMSDLEKLTTYLTNKF
jgi:hypothetical protein